MTIDVHLTDGRTVLRLIARGQLAALVKRDPAALTDGAGSIRCWKDHGGGEGFHPTRLQFLRHNQIGWVEQVPVADRDEFLGEHDPEALARVRAKEADREARERMGVPATAVPRTAAA